KMSEVQILSTPARIHLKRAWRAFTPSPMSSCDTSGIAEWMIDGARSASLPQDVLQELCDRLVGCGIPLWRVAVLVRTLHPEVTGRRLLWRRGVGVAVGE